MTRQTKKTKRACELIRAIYGQSGTLRYSGSVHEGDEIDDVELTLHELSHQVLLPSHCILLGDLKSAVKEVQDYISNLSGCLKDVHEIRAVAIEILVSRHWQLGIRERALIANSLDNTELFSDRFGDEGWSKRRFARTKATYNRLIRKALVSRQVLNGASIINGFLHELERLRADQPSNPAA